MQVALCGGVKVKVKNCLEISADVSGLRERRGACTPRLGSLRSPSRRCLSDKKCYARIFIRARALLGQVAGATLHAPGWMPRYTTRESWLLTHAQTSGPASARWSRDLLHSSQMHRSHSHPLRCIYFYGGRVTRVYCLLRDGCCFTQGFMTKGKWCTFQTIFPSSLEQHKVDARLTALEF